jgi:hypothetical protein
MKKVELITPWQRLWRLLGSEKAVLTRVFLIAGFGGLISLSLPLGIQAIINFIMAGRASTSLVLLVFFVLIGIFVSGLLIIRQQWLIEFFQQRVFARASLEFSLRIPRIKFDQFERCVCPKHGLFTQYAYQFKKGRGCPTCGAEQRAESKRHQMKQAWQNPEEREKMIAARNSKKIARANP